MLSTRALSREPRPPDGLVQDPGPALYLTVVLCPRLILPMFRDPLRALELRQLSLTQPRSLQPAPPLDGRQKGAGALRETPGHREKSFDPKYGETLLAFFNTEYSMS